VNPSNEELARQRAAVVAQREELSRTIQVLADKVDVPARAREVAASARFRLASVGRRYLRPELALGAVAAVATAVSIVAFARYRRTRG